MVAWLEDLSDYLAFPCPCLRGGRSPSRSLLSISSNMSCIGNDTCSMATVSWKCILFSELKSPGLGSVYYSKGLKRTVFFQDWNLNDIFSSQFLLSRRDVFVKL